jgi:hypothetical protein
LLATDRLYDWVAFEFGAYHFGLQHRLPPGTPLARISQPHTQLVIAETEVRFGDADTRYTRVLQRLLADGVPAAPPGAPIEVSGDGADYRGRVATAIAEIESDSKEIVEHAISVRGSLQEIAVQAPRWSRTSSRCVNGAACSIWARRSGPACAVLRCGGDLFGRRRDGCHAGVAGRLRARWADLAAGRRRHHRGVDPDREFEEACEEADDAVAALGAAGLAVARGNGAPVISRWCAPGLTSPLPRSVRSSVWCWLAAVACGVLESLVNAVTSPDYNVAVQLSIREVVYVLVTLLIVRLSRGENWVRLALTVLLGHADLKNRLADGLYISVTSKGQPQVYFRRSIDSSLPGAHQVVHLGDLSLLSGDDHLRQLDRIRTLTMGDLGVRHGHRALVVIDHRRQPQVVEGRAAQ